MGTVTNPVRFGGHRYFASQRPGQRSPPRYPPLSLPNAHSTPGRKALGSGPRGAPLSSLWRKAEEAARFRCRPRGVAGNPGSTDSGAQTRLRAAASPLPQSALGPAAPPPHPPSPRVRQPRRNSQRPRRAQRGGRRRQARPRAAAAGPAQPARAHLGPRRRCRAHFREAGDCARRRRRRRSGPARRGGAGAEARAPIGSQRRPAPPASPGAEAAPRRPRRALGSFVLDWCVCSLACYQAVSEPLIGARHWAKRCDGPPR